MKNKLSENLHNSAFLPSEWTARHKPDRPAPALQGCPAKTRRLTRTLSGLRPRRLWWRRTPKCPGRRWVLQYPVEPENAVTPASSFGTYSTRAHNDLWPLRSRWRAGSRRLPAGARWSEAARRRTPGSCTETDPKRAGTRRGKTSPPPWCRDPNPAWTLLQSEGGEHK